MERRVDAVRKAQRKSIGVDVSTDSLRGPKRERRIYRILRWYLIPATAFAGLVVIGLHYLL